MVEHGGGVVVNIASVGALRPRKGLVWYNASKGAVVNVCFAHDDSKNSTNVVWSAG